MPYRFTFDLSRISRFFFTEVATAAYQRDMHRKVGKTAQDMIKKFKIQEATGLNLSDAVTLLEDLIDVQARNLMERERFIQTKRRALLLPHCSRKFMDSRCKATFDPALPSYVCAHCSPDCQVGKAELLAKERGYDVYILPGGSCIPKILNANHYEGVIGVACGEEVKIGGETLKAMNISGQTVPLIKNGCANTAFNIENLSRIL
ncbi:MAG TPA: DUF116 domain-containing protein [candidate division Zixibacteria bacterium]|nr:DUF116 domain-containing protein [candidate division Zixibacteria bacterium]